MDNYSKSQRLGWTLGLLGSSVFLPIAAVAAAFSNEPLDAAIALASFTAIVIYCFGFPPWKTNWQPWVSWIPVSALMTILFFLAHLSGRHGIRPAHYIFINYNLATRPDPLDVQPQRTPAAIIVRLRSAVN
jgi:hypothetical protein